MRSAIIRAQNEVHAFIKDFARHGIGSFRDVLLYGAGDYRDIIMYVPFAALATVDPLLRLAAWIHKLRNYPTRLSIGQHSLI